MNHKNKMRIFLSVIFTGSILFASCEKEKSGDQPEHSPGAEIQFLIDLPEQNEPLVFIATVSRKEATIEDAMNTLKEEGEISFAMKGSGETAFIESIEEVKNQGSQGKNWVYAVNGVPGTASVGATRISDGDEVRWCFTGWNESSACGKPSDIEKKNSDNM